jgi:hypothetical protein
LIGDLGELAGGAALGVVDHDLDLGGAALADPLPPAEITSCIEAPRIAPGSARRAPRAPRR